MNLTTARLWIVPLNPEQLRSYVLQDGDVESLLDWTRIDREVSDRTREKVISKVIPEMVAHDDDAHFLTFWILVEKETMNPVGEFCFKGLPNENGEVEIGYAVFPDQRNRGFMTEGLVAIADRALSALPHLHIHAWTKEDNIASQRVLIKAGFREESKSEGEIKFGYSR